MNASIELNHQASFGATEIDHISSNWVLTPKLKSFKAQLSQKIPSACFRFGCCLTQSSPTFNPRWAAVEMAGGDLGFSKVFLLAQDAPPHPLTPCASTLSPKGARVIAIEAMPSPQGGEGYKT